MQIKVRVLPRARQNNIVAESDGSLRIHITAVPENGKYFEGLFSTRNGMRRPEIYYKSCDGLLHLQKVTDAALFHKACEIAISMGQYNYHFVFQMVDSRCMGYVTNPTEDSEAPEDTRLQCVP